MPSLGELIGARMRETSISRRGFLRGAASATAGVAGVAALGACSSPQPDKPLPTPKPIQRAATAAEVDSVYQDTFAEAQAILKDHVLNPSYVGDNTVYGLQNTFREGKGSIIGDDQDYFNFRRASYGFQTGMTSPAFFIDVDYDWDKRSTRRQITGYTVSLSADETGQTGEEFARSILQVPEEIEFHTYNLPQGFGRKQRWVPVLVGQSTNPDGTQVTITIEEKPWGQKNIEYRYERTK